MEDNLARELEIDFDQQSVAIEQPYNQPLGRPYQETVPNVEPIPQAKPVSKGLTKFEMSLMSVIGIVFFAMILMNVHSDLQLSSASRELQDVNGQIAQTQIEIENLKQQSHELSRYDRVTEIAAKYGLELHDENIVNIAPQE